VRKQRPSCVLETWRIHCYVCVLRRVTASKNSGLVQHDRCRLVEAPRVRLATWRVHASTQRVDDDQIAVLGEAAVDRERRRPPRRMDAQGKKTS
jgi:hypothetical protein